MSDDVFQRCLKLVRLLNTEHGWGLTHEATYHHARKVTAYCASMASIRDAQICAAIEHYHKDHGLVEALLDSDHPEHARYWAEWTHQTMCILGAKAVGARPPDEIVASLEDLVQEASQDLWRGLPNFSYQSSFQTWAFAVISHCLARQYRTHQTQKRAALPPAQSLDNVPAADETLHHRMMPTPEEAATSALLVALIDRVLRQHPDNRIALVFHLWANEDQTLRVIGDKLGLSPTRVHALLQQAITLLRSEQAIQRWREVPI